MHRCVASAQGGINHRLNPGLATIRSLLRKLAMSNLLDGNFRGIPGNLILRRSPVNRGAVRAWTRSPGGMLNEAAISVDDARAMAPELRVFAVITALAAGCTMANPAFEGVQGGGAGSGGRGGGMSGGGRSG